jgi:hypothetical protein
MHIKKLTRRQFFLGKGCLFLSVFLALAFFSPRQACQAASLDELHRPLPGKGNILYQTAVDYFTLDEEGTHGSSAYEDIKSRPHFYLLDNLLKFAPSGNLEVALGFNQALPASYRRSIFNTAGNLAVTQDYDLNYFRDYTAGLRLRQGPIEAYLDVLEKRQKDDWRAALYPASPIYFSYIRSHYEDFKAGFRYLGADNTGQKPSNLSRITRPLLGARQINIETQLGYKSGALRRNVYYYTGGFRFLNFYHTLTRHLVPSLVLRYGLSQELEIESGLSYAAPFKYKFEYKDQAPTGTTSLIGTYDFDNNFRFPFRMRYRPLAPLEVMFSSDFSFAQQTLDYYRQASGAVNNYSTKKLSYFNIQPTIGLTYLYENGKQIEEDRFLSLTKRLLLRNQFLLELCYQKDLTYLHKNSANGPQNLIDPENVFLYPLDYFVGGSEYAAFFTGNNSGLAANVAPQNYYIYRLGFNYGLTDRLNAGFRVGYHSSSHLHHFTLGDPTPTSYDLKSRFYKFKPYYSFDLVSDWRVTHNSMLSFGVRFVPEETTLLKIEGQPQEFKAKDRYFTASLSLKILFP